MYRYTIDIDNELEQRLHTFMEENNINKRSKAIKRCILIATDKESDKSYIYNFDERLNTILYRLNVNKKILEQLFVNMEFNENNNISNNKLLKELYEDYKVKYFKRGKNG